MNEESLFAQAIAIQSPEERARFLDEACGDDHELRVGVESLLRHAEIAGSFLEHPPLEAAVRAISDADIDATILPDEGSTCDDDASLQGQQHVQHKSSQPTDLSYLLPSDNPESLGRLGHYEILEVIGRGAFGTVLRAFDEKLQRVVAIKVLAPQMAATSPARKRFLREARTSAAVRHENVVAIYAVEDEPIPYLVMEYIPGKTLQQQLDSQGPLDLPHVLKLGKQIADGLAAAHEQGLIHRDIKPGNILLEHGIDDRVKITDFGLARTADDASMTQSGVIAGTPMYMAPEQALGKKLDQRADLFSFGSVLYQMLSGRPPFRAPSTVAVLKRVVEDTPRPIQEILPEVPQWMCALIDHLHAKLPEDRFESAKEVSGVLEKCLADLEAGRTPTVAFPINGGSQTTGQPAPTEPRRRPQPVWRQPLAKVAALIVIALIFLGVAEFSGVTNITHLFTADEEALADEVKVATVKSAAELPQQPSTEEPAKKVVETTVMPAPRPQSIEWPADAPAMAIPPFDSDQAHKYQQAWANYLGLPVEKQIMLGRDKRGLDVSMTMILIPPGEYLMGSTEEEIAQLRDKAVKDGLRRHDLAWISLEGPQRTVKITRPFYMSKNEMRTEQFRVFVTETDYQTEPEANGKGAWLPTPGVPQLDPTKNWRQAGKYPQGSQSPVVNVTWNDANKCCEWLSQIEPGWTYSIPTEAQWEYAARAGTTTYWSTGNDEASLADHAVVNVSWPQDIGDRLPNPFGLCDMHGNVFEWCQDAFYNYRDADTVDPLGVVGGEKQIIRGGSCFGGYRFSNDWANNSGCRSASRFERRASNPWLAVGIRVIADIPEETIQAKLTAAPKAEEKE
ncbi:bifunctional serine/threonine-protein kinase/formylglycine-generating enzyme family protein [Blastopirellula sp. JC732]|uniref:non-specific serine/threonine protein kinase n=1 Tax=Blastopirellula sediminis TaxID=2894196 RepID=A0A9X1SI35_9BACT|nr:bifunctional serine/threonine-protein kinase/formylglycine-generating enzyme family protein [Blastopirellula sediminis]MCC9609489.1 bifunctional serine/threonine-protein kinase/formylglycine-generating enzyme family protein [Blastopirellula sediminis]MCC9627734.1 bifunctional serine/threonine-protein kinase/formylglycine-generating enzyme family protein [Blastopirellula sediminis]